ncbi:hypothetical protein GXW83_18920 [Streptacidiphilus sp. PB12-B1b]|uniref:hypothetical protein n=1 Tax=Streptacidiphilus sp. PB12-B1b TaxID=2705012 RepID=UPI0015FBA50F|nr:hypothetical protein [Streptacidiphilus sp. PB12-B1b]QMU77462.1 hypothetical protein GXW83_18920 [Streptacidiphilus sp. PB12-B1b]
MPTTALTPEIETRFAAARRIAGALLFAEPAPHAYTSPGESHGLRPDCGVLVPPAWGAESDEPSSQRTECLMEPHPDATLLAELRFLHVRRGTLQRTGPDGAYQDVPELRLADRVLTPWSEGVEERIQLAVKVSELRGEGRTLPFDRPACEETEAVYDDSRHLIGRIVLRRAEVRGVIRLAVAEVPGPRAVQRLTAVVHNADGWTPQRSDSDGDAVLARSLMSTHLMLGLGEGAFLSMAAPPEWAGQAAADCENLHTWPALADPIGDVVLSSPLRLPDHAVPTAEEILPLQPTVGGGTAQTDGEFVSTA